MRLDVEGYALSRSPAAHRHELISIFGYRICSGDDHPGKARQRFNIDVGVEGRYKVDSFASNGVFAIFTISRGVYGIV